MTKLTLVALSAIAVAVIGGAAPASSQEFVWEALDVDMVVTDILRESVVNDGDHTYNYLFVVDVTNTGTRTVYVSFGSLSVDTDFDLHDGNCSIPYDTRIAPGATETLTECYTVPGGSMPLSINMLGYDDTAEYYEQIAVLPFSEEFGDECPAIYPEDHDICLDVQAIASMIRDVQPGEIADHPATVSEPAASIPGQPANRTATISGAAYDWETNQLAVNFIDEINPFIIDASKVVVADGTCAISLIFEEYDLDNWSTQYATFNLTEANRSVLASMDNPVMHIQEGAFSTFDGKTKLPASDIILDVTGTAPDIYSGTPCAITYGFSEAILDAYAYNYTETVQAIHDGFNAWSDLNPDLVFEWADDDPLITVEWSDYHPEHIGLACLDCLVNGASMEIILYRYDCNGGRVYYMPNNIRNTVAHELGHILGLEHHQDETHLMYGDKHVQNPFITLGYAVPENLPEGLIGEDRLDDEISRVADELEKVRNELDERLLEIERFEAAHVVERGSDGKVYFSTSSEVHQAKRMTYDYNNLVDEYNALLGEYNALIDEANCILGFSPTTEPDPASTP